LNWIFNGTFQTRAVSRKEFLKNEPLPKERGAGGIQRKNLLY
jgi:hypothetical protein